MTKDTQQEPVTVEEEIASLIAAGEEAENDRETDQGADSGPREEGGDNLRGSGSGDDISDISDDEPDESEEEDASSEADEDADDDADTSELSEEEDAPQLDLEDSEGEEDHLDPPEHWAAADKERFNSVPREAQEFLLARHKSMEGDYTRKSQEIAAVKRQYDAIQDALAPYQQEFASAGLDHAGAVRQLAHWHTALKNSPREAIQELAKTYGVDLSAPDLDDETTDPTLRAIQQELGSVKQSLTRNEQLAQQREQEQLLATIQSFQTATDESGALKHPHFETLKDDITTLFQMGKVNDLETGYNMALKFHPDLAPAPKPKPAIKEEDPAEKVKKAKRAATGVKSSGAVGKRNRKEMTLEEEIASHFS